MGNKIIILFCSISFLLAQSKYPEIDRLIEMVKTKRVGLQSIEIESLKDPFTSKKKLIRIERKVIKKKFSKKRAAFKLTSIFNDRARINGRWYKIGSKVGGYRLVRIEDDRAVLRRGDKKFLYLFLHKKRRKIIKSWSK